MSENQRDLKARVLEYLEENRGKRVYLSRMTEDLGETPKRVQRAMIAIRNQHIIGIKSIAQGHSWLVEPVEKDTAFTTTYRNTPTTHEGRTTYTEISTLKAGVLLERNDGVLFKGTLTKVDL